MENENNLISQAQEIATLHAEEIDAIKEENIIEMKELLRDFDSSKILFKQEISKIQQQLKEADIKYENRESREDDLEIIKDLNATIDKYREDLLKAQDQANFYKLELCNREINFNKIFNSPLLGPVQSNMVILIY